LLEEAKAGGHREAYKTLNKESNFRIGVGVRLTPTNVPSFFVEILVYLCHSLSEADLIVLEKSLSCLKQLQARNFSLTCQDGNCVSCEKATTIQNLPQEYAAVKSIAETVFG